MKICPTCKFEKPYTEFSKHKYTKDGYRCQCRECCKQYRIANIDKAKQWYKDNSDKLKKSSKQYYQLNKNRITQRNKQYSQLNKPTLIKYMKEYVKQNATKLKEYHKEYYQLHKTAIKENVSKYSQTEQGKLVKRTTMNKRRILKLQNTPIGKHFTPADIKLKLKLQHNKCVYCQVNIKELYQIDHIIPISKNGSSESWNIQLLCKKCNLTKQAKLPHEYAQEHGKLL